jgi:hypothetical protein
MDPLNLQPKTDPDNVMDPHDSGWRKYFLVFVGLACITGGMVWADVKPGRAILYDTYGQLVLFLIGMYFGVNVGTKFAAGKVNADVTKNQANAEASIKKAAETAGKAIE